MQLAPSTRKLLRSQAAIFGFILVMSGFSGEAVAQVVQLPAFQQFSYSGSVSAPDSGHAALGSNRSLRSGNTGGTSIGGRTFGTQNNGGGLSMTATIIDLGAMDQSLLNQSIDSAANNLSGRGVTSPGAASRPNLPYAGRPKRGLPHTESNDWQMALGSPGTSNIRQDAVAASDSDVRYYMLKARQATDVGRIAAARVYYRMALESMSEQQRERLLAIQSKASQVQSTATTGTEKPGTVQSAKPQSGNPNSRSF